MWRFVCNIFSGKSKGTHTSIIQLALFQTYICSFHYIYAIQCKEQEYRWPTMVFSVMWSNAIQNPCVQWQVLNLIQIDPGIHVRLNRTRNKGQQNKTWFNWLSEIFADITFYYILNAFTLKYYKMVSVYLAFISIVTYVIESMILLSASDILNKHLSMCKNVLFVKKGVRCRRNVKDV